MTTGNFLHSANQPPPLEGYDLFSENRPLVEALRREGGGAEEERCAAFGRRCGDEPLELGRLANEYPPVLRTRDRFGERIDEVEFHPSWHELLGLGVEHGLHSLPWREPGNGHVVRAALFMTLAYAEAGVGCPLSMTFAAVPALRTSAPDLAAEWETRLASTTYDPGPRSHLDKSGALCGMAMTERQGGSDVRANTTIADRSGDLYRLSGEKWFCSAPMSDAFLVLAQARDGLTCFLLPRLLDDGTRNGFRIERLKDKLGNRSNASAEIRLEDAVAHRVGDEGRGVATIIEMVVHTRLDCVLGSAALMRRAVAEATHHAAHRATFGRLLSEQPLQRNVLADLCLDSEAATATALRLARAFDEARPRVQAARDERSRSTGSASRRRPSSRRRSSAWAATGTSRSPACRGSTARARSIPSGRGRATSTASTSSGRSSASPRAARRSGRSSTSPMVPTGTSTTRSTASTPIWTLPTSPAPAASSSDSRSASRARSSSGTRPPRLPTPSARPGSEPRADAPTERCRPAWTQP